MFWGLPNIISKDPGHISDPPKGYMGESSSCAALPTVKKKFSNVANSTFGAKKDQNQVFARYK